MDWGLLMGSEKNWLLRDKLYYPKCYYYFAMITNLILRLDWIVVYTVKDPLQEIHLISFILGVLELVRRAQWATLRVENENINNFEKYRIIEDIPLVEDEIEFD